MNESNFVTKSKVAHRDNTFYRPHPGSVFKRRCISDESTNTEEIARSIGLSVQELNNFINGELDLDAILAEEVASYSGIGADTWLHYQRHYDLFKASLRTLNDKKEK